MYSNLPTNLAMLRASSLSDVRRHIGHGHLELESGELARLQQAFIRIPYAADQSSLMHFGELSLSLQQFVRQLLQHYIVERELLQIEDDAAGFDRSASRPLLAQLRRDHQILQESLSDLQLRTEKFHEAVHSKESLRFSQILATLAYRLHEQILEEDRVLFPRSSCI